MTTIATITAMPRTTSVVGSMGPETITDVGPSAPPIIPTAALSFAQPVRYERTSANKTNLFFIVSPIEFDRFDL